MISSTYRSLVDGNGSKYGTFSLSCSSLLYQIVTSNGLGNSMKIYPSSLWSFSFCILPSQLFDDYVKMRGLDIGRGSRFLFITGNVGAVADR